MWWMPVHLKMYKFELSVFHSYFVSSNAFYMEGVKKKEINFWRKEKNDTREIPSRNGSLLCVT